jgi:hypothetical protein
LANSLIASASLASVKRTSTFFFSAPWSSRPAKTRALSDRSFAQKFGTEDHLAGRESCAYIVNETDRNGGLDDNGRTRVRSDCCLDDRLYRRRIELVSVSIVVGGRGDNDIVGSTERVLRIERCGQVQRSSSKKVLQLRVNNGRLAGIEHFDTHCGYIDCDHLIMLSQQNSIGQTDIA